MSEEIETFEPTRWENLQLLQVQERIGELDESGVPRTSNVLVYEGTGTIDEVAPNLADSPPQPAVGEELTRWSLGRDFDRSSRLSVARSDQEEPKEWHEVKGITRGQLTFGPFLFRTGNATKLLLGAAALGYTDIDDLQAGRVHEGAAQFSGVPRPYAPPDPFDPDRIELGLRHELIRHLQDAVDAPLRFRITKEADGPEGSAGERRDVTERVITALEGALAELKGGRSRAALSADRRHWHPSGGFALTPETLEALLGTKPTPTLPDTPEHAPSPFQGDGEAAHILSGPFSSAVTRSLVETPGEGDRPAEEFLRQWGADSTGHPIRVEELHGQYGGRVTFRVQAYGEPDPTAVDAEVGWAMLQEMDMGTAWLHALLLAHASAPGRRGERNVIRLPRTRVEKLLGFRSRNKTKWERAEVIRGHMDQLRSVFVQFQNVEKHGDRLRFRHDMSATPLWNIRMVAQGERDLFTGHEMADWHMEAREGLWAEEFLHTHGDQWAPLPKAWFEQIDRRGNDWTERLAIFLIFLFRTNRQKGGRVTLSAQRMLETCGVDLEAERSKDDRYDLKQKLSRALEDLAHNYGVRVQDEDVNISKIDGRSYWTGWKNQTVIFDPPEKIDRALLSGEEPRRPPLPDVRPGRWSGRQIKRLLGQLGWTQKKLAEHLPVGKQSVSHYVNGRRAPGDDVREALDRLQARYS